MKTLFLLALVVLASAFTQSFQECFDSFKTVKQNLMETLDSPNVNEVVDAMENVFQEVPNLMQKCGAEEMAEETRTEFPPICTRLLAQEAKLLIKIMRLYADDKVKNEKSILMYSSLFESVYKNQVQKKCPFLEKQPITLETKNKGECAEGLYQLSLTFEQLDFDVMAGKFNVSLTDLGKIVQKLPDTLDSCNQHQLAKFIRYNFPAECLSAIGGFAREVATIEHNYSHIDWLMNHFKDFTSALIRVKDACPALSN